MHALVCADSTAHQGVIEGAGVIPPAACRPSRALLYISQIPLHAYGERPECSQGVCNQTYQRGRRTKAIEWKWPGRVQARERPQDHTGWKIPAKEQPG